MKRLAVVVLGLVLAAGAAYGQGTIVGSKHDLGSGGTSSYTATNTTEVCVFCHTPHQAASANKQDPLWNHSFPAGTPAYGVYASATFNGSSTIQQVGSVVGSASASMLCMSCHDGTVGVGSLYNPPNAGAPDNAADLITGTANLGNAADAHSDDHPINFTYDAALVTADTAANGGKAGLKAPSDAGVAPLLFSGMVQCASCHDVHDPSNTPFLVKANTNSALCTTCHIK